MRKKNFLSCLAAVALLFMGCGGSGNSASSAAGTPASDTAATVKAEFDADRAFALVERQCAFGARVPGSPAHKACGDWLEAELSRLCDSVVTQRAAVTTFDNTRLNIRNFIGIVNPQAEKRILLLAHWDCRPWADADPDPAKQRTPVMGANDAASGVAVILELARQFSLKKPGIGVDLLLSDAEDWGIEGNDDSWALGTQHWAASPHTAGYRPMFGILLDMVGAEGARFAPEYFSTQYAGGFVALVWDTAQTLGYSSHFTADEGGAVTDDHIFVNRAGIPCLDIIDMRPDTGSGFFNYWHTDNDTPQHIDRATLKAVGHTLSHLIYNFKD